MDTVTKDYRWTGHVVSLGCICSFGFINNLLILILVIRFRAVLLTPSNIYLLSKAFADWLLLAISPFHLISLANPEGWFFGGIECHIVTYLDLVFMLISLHSLLAISHQRFAIFVKPDWYLDNKKALGHVLAIWIYCACIAFPIVTASYIFKWEERTVCGYRWPPIQSYYAMYFVSLSIIAFIGPFGQIMWWSHRVRKAIGLNSQDQRKPVGMNAREDVKCTYKVTITLFITALLRWVPFWMYHFTILLTLEGDQTRSFHVPGGHKSFQLVVTYTTYIVASANFIVYLATMTKWRSVVFNALLCRSRAASSSDTANSRNHAVVNTIDKREMDVL